MNEPAALRGRTALVTGSSTGIGAAIAIELARSGADVVVHGRDQTESLESVAHEVSKCGSTAHIASCDFSIVENLDSFAGSVWRQTGGLDILVNNAGGDVLTGPRAAAPFAEKLDYLWRVDVVAALTLSRSIGTRMVAAAGESGIRGQKTVVNIGWDQAHQGMSGDSGEMFATIKGAVASMTRSLAQSLAPEVRVNCVAPGWIKTDWGEQASRHWTDRALSESLMDRWGEPDDVARAVCFLVGDRASFISGQILPVNGGFRFFQGKQEIQ